MNAPPSTGCGPSRSARTRATCRRRSAAGTSSPIRRSSSARSPPGCGATAILEIGGSSGISTIALAAAARRTNGRLVSIEIEPARQAESKRTLADLGLADRVDYVLADAGDVLDRYGDLQFVLIDCEKDDYVRFFDRLRLAPGAVVVADNILSHDLQDYVRHVRAVPGVQSVTLPIGKGLEVSRIAGASDAPPLTRAEPPLGAGSLYTVAPMFVTRTRSADPA